MKRIAIFIFLVIFLASLRNTGAVSSTFRDVYSPKETMIGQLSGDVIAPIEKAQISLVRDRHIEIGFEYDIKVLGDNYYIWLTAPENPGNYTLIAKDVVAMVEGYPQIIDYKKDFRVEGNASDYSIKPGFVFSDKDFQISVTLYESSSKKINVDFPGAREITLRPGVNYVYFPINSVIGAKLINFNLGKYEVPAYIIGTGYKAECNEDSLGLCTTESECANAGGYWYNNNCSKYEEGSVCDSGHVELCATNESCLNVSGHWYSDKCNSEERSYNCGDGLVSGNEVCDNSSLGEKNCTDVGNYSSGELKCSNDCLSFDVSECLIPEIKFRFNPKAIRGVALISEHYPIYPFGIYNFGESPIRDLRIDYNKQNFIVAPEQISYIGANESALFNLTFKNITNNRAKGVIVARAGNKIEYLSFSINLTSNKTNVHIEYVGGSLPNANYYCLEIPGSSGRACSGDESCSGEEVLSIDIAKCCVGSCEKAGGSNSWIGYLIVAVVVLVLIVVYFKYRKAGRAENTFSKKVAQVERKLP